MATKKPISIHWFRQDLRLSDNPALSAAIESGDILPIYILDDINSNDSKMGEASRWWLHHSLSSLNKKLDGKISFYNGDPKEIFSTLSEQYNVKSIYWNRCYEPWRIKRDKDLKISLENKNIHIKTHNGSLLWEPWTVLKNDGTPYRVFSPYYKRGCLDALAPREPIKEPSLSNIISNSYEGLSLNDLDLLPNVGWYEDMENLWSPGEDGAKEKLHKFLDYGLLGYKEGRNFPSRENVSQLSPHMHFGEVSPNQVWYGAQLKEGEKGIDKDLKHFLSELGWREFSYSLLYHFPTLPKENLQKKFDNFPWIENSEYFEKWKKGQTGYPIVDAGMRELWQTGYMHNRVRMIVGSFLVKNLLLHWHEGEKWFWDCLIDADLASNSASWQWVAGSGADAAPYFRIFNPVTQGLRFDPDGEYTKKYVPELKDLPSKYLYSPWEAPLDILNDAGVTLGKNYPNPVVDLKQSREKALDAFSVIRIK
jgi:deoxyribodipyrimidine photo-lyase